MPGWSFLEDDQLGILVEFEVSFLCVLFHVFSSLSRQRGRLLLP